MKDNFDLTILFWFYKKPRICENRLKILKHHNPNVKIFGLYGGEKKEFYKYKKISEKYFDDVYISPFKDADWKWINGDLVLLDWYKNRGKKLNWNSVIVIQWDMLFLDSIKNQFKNIKKGQIYLSGLCKVDKEIENKWSWTKPSNSERKNYLSFLRYVRKNYEFKKQPLCCLFILQIFPKKFFDKYLLVKNKKVGMLEYKIPIYADIFKIPFYKKDLGIFWFQKNKNFPLNAIPRQIEESYILKEIKKKSGWRVFHPYNKIWET